MIDIYESAVDHEGIYGCVFERDDETAYLYLLDMTGGEGRIVLTFDAHQVTAMPANVDTEVRFSSQADIVGLLADGKLMAVYDLSDRTAPQGRWATDADHKRFSPN